MKQRTNENDEIRGIRNDKEAENTPKKKSARKRKAKRYSTRTDVADYRFRNTRKSDKLCEDDSIARAVIKSPKNDFAWYNKNPELVTRAGSFSFAYPSGINLQVAQDTETTNYDGLNFVPGILIQDVIPGIGWSQYEGGTLAEACNIAARDIYAYVRHANSGHSNYEASDLMLYLLAMDECYMFYQNCCRAYGLMYLANNQNKYINKALVDNLGFDYDSLATNLSELNYLINLTASRLNAFAVPSAFPLYQRHMWLYSGVYCDDIGARAQLYALKPLGYRTYTTMFDNENNPVAGYLHWKYFNTSEETVGVMGKYHLTIDDIRSVFNDMIGSLISDEDIGTMSGDIIKAYGDALYTVNAIPLNYGIMPVYDVEVLNQIANATPLPISGGFKTYSNSTSLLPHSLDIGQNPSQEGAGKLVYQPILINRVPSDNAMFANRILNVSGGYSGTPEEVMTSTRLTVIPQQDFEGITNNTYFPFMGTEICGYAHVVIGTVEKGFEEYLMSYWTEVSAARVDRLTAVGAVSSFRYSPQIYIWMNSDDETPITHTMSTMKLDQFTVLHGNQLRNLHDVAILSLFNVPNR